MSDALEAIDDIIKALDEDGSDITIRSVTKGEFDTSTGEYPQSVSDNNTKTFPQTFSSFELQNSDIFITDKRFVLYSDTEISYNDILLFMGKEYKIHNIIDKVYKTTAILYTIQGRANAT